jgi:hypothetical protein
MALRGSQSTHGRNLYLLRDLQHLDIFLHLTISATRIVPPTVLYLEDNLMVNSDTSHRGLLGRFLRESSFGNLESLFTENDVRASTFAR